MIRAVMFDVGECLVDETRLFGSWADRLGVPRHTFSAVFGAVVAEGRDFRDAFQVFRPGFDFDAEDNARAEADPAAPFGGADVHPDVRDSLTALRADGLWLGIAGNQPARAARALRELFSPDVDFIGTSDDWGAAKPDPRFFRRVTEIVPAEPAEILYVGDRVDNDIRPGAAAGLHTALVRRGPWATLTWDTPEARSLPTFRVESLLELSFLIRDFNAQPH